MTQEAARPTSDEQLTSDERQKMITRLAGWIDTGAIAELIVDHLADEGKSFRPPLDKPTLKLCQELWLNELEELGAKLA